MGGYPSVAYSQPLVCPSDCDQQTWQQILTLYDRLDANGDHAIENKELQTIAKNTVGPKSISKKEIIPRLNLVVSLTS